MDIYSYTQDGSFQCNVCEEWFTSVESLTDHQELHLLIDTALGSNLKLKLVEKQRRSSTQDTGHVMDHESDDTLEIKRHSSIKHIKPTTSSTLNRTRYNPMEDGGNLRSGDSNNSTEGEKPYSYTCVKRRAEKYQFDAGIGKEKRQKLAHGITQGDYGSKAKEQGESLPESIATKLLLPYHPENSAPSNDLGQLMQDKHHEQYPSWVDQPSKGPKNENSVKVQCPYCPKFFARNRDIGQHVRDLHPEHSHLWVAQLSSDQQTLPHVCKVCSKGFKHKDLLKNHVRLSHKEEYRESWEKHVCKACGKRFVHIDHLVNHLKMDHVEEYEAYEKEKKSNPFIFGQQCLICSEYCVDSPALTKHAEIHQDGNGFFRCSIHCDQKFGTIYDINAHYVKNSLKFYDCRRCDIEYVNRSNWINHNMKHHGYSVGLFVCELCDDEFSEKHGLNKHMRYRHKGVKKNIRCTPACGAYFSDEDTYKKHIVKKHCESVRVFKFVEDDRFQCTICDMTFEDMNNFLQHCGLKHKLDRQKDVSNIVLTTDSDTLAMQNTLPTCSKCNMLFSDYDVLKFHMKREHKSAEDEDSAEETQMEPCMQNFLQRFQLHRHIQKKH